MTLYPLAAARSDVDLALAGPLMALDAEVIAYPHLLEQMERVGIALYP